MHRVANAVAGAGVPHAKAFAGTFQKQVGFGVQVVGLHQAVVDVLYAGLGVYTVEPHGF